MVKCVFCGSDKSGHLGVNLITNDGNINFYCSSKCRKNALKLKRDKRKVRWTESFYIARKKSIEKIKELASKEAIKKKEEKEHEKQSEGAEKEQKKEKKGNK